MGGQNRRAAMRRAWSGQTGRQAQSNVHVRAWALMIGSNGRLRGENVDATWFDGQYCSGWRQQQRKGPTCAAVHEEMWYDRTRPTVAYVEGFDSKVLIVLLSRSILSQYGIISATVHGTIQCRVGHCRRFEQIHVACLPVARHRRTLMASLQPAAADSLSTDMLPTGQLATSLAVAASNLCATDGQGYKNTVGHMCRTSLHKDNCQMSVYLSTTDMCQLSGNP
ncbi:unnamed protein product [Periconia digitata]|uniref:Uncharacterized protein n=1 Tax=Periconia digitata TaxID=1303443 RepID=A0A9W4UDJ0_9PLEO|nr:unnamed protein product [Periconia digitata]